MASTLSLLVLVLTSGIAVCTPFGPRSQGLLETFSSLVVFGDSYTDDGVYDYIPPVGSQTTDAWDGGRAWPSYIQQYTGVNLYDYAVAGAVCDSVVSNSVRNGVEQDQLPAFLADNVYVSNTTGQPALINKPDETIYAIWIGTNDLGPNGFLTEAEPAGMPLTYFTDCVYTQLDRLYAVGARTFVLMNIAPLNLAPEYATPQNGGLPVGEYWTDKSSYDPNITQSSEKMRQYLTMVNAVFDYQTPYDLLLASRYPGGSFAIYDVHALMTDIWENPSHYLNGTVPYNVTSSIYRCGSPCSSNAVRSSYMWYNDLHPSEQTDRVIAREFVNLVKGQSKWGKFWRS
ncbi:GDSL Lipase/Acylhydrolase family protein [Aspergillus ellipticus CBS 707.79]|uniref:GDSL Lipase/Acylhydrolase family protein n=1 Tax=Aspergillus ellipticus CBS 707.79 TaxID=1448320 RepID=A0A319EWF2_9EURO|nr:GDSL Lipase/Acylhydrolase family protein [Aspergillus ellipticus CBS 707.79]